MVLSVLMNYTNTNAFHTTCDIVSKAIFLISEKGSVREREERDRERGASEMKSVAAFGESEKIKNTYN